MTAVCTAMMLLYLAVAVGRTIAATLPLVDPALSTAHLQCDTQRCRVEMSPHRLLTGSDKQAEALPSDRKAQLIAWIQRPSVKAMLFLGEVIRGLPVILLFLSLAMASRALSRARGFAETLHWLRRAAAAALAVVLTQPIADTIRATTLSPIEVGKQQIHLAFNGGPVLWGVLLAGAVWMSVWALEQARLNEIELGTIV